jgi:glycosyltransferase involved in cell wall biosynthesis
MDEILSSSTEGAYRQTMVLIPAYNARQTIGSVVREVKQVSPAIVTLVVDDGSVDITAMEAEQAGALVARHERNMGKGTALRTGFREFLKGDFEAVITLDADGQHSPYEIPKLIECWLGKKADIVIGTRKRDLHKMPMLRILTNTVSSWLVSLSAGRYIEDSQSGFRLISRRVIERVATRSKGYGAESEILIKAASRGYVIASAPISTIYKNEKSYIHPLKQPILFLGLIFRSFFWRFEGIGKDR